MKGINETCLFPLVAFDVYTLYFKWQLASLVRTPETLKINLCCFCERSCFSGPNLSLCSGPVSNSLLVTQTLALLRAGEPRVYRLTGCQSISSGQFCASQLLMITFEVCDQ